MFKTKKLLLEAEDTNISQFDVKQLIKNKEILERIISEIIRGIKWTQIFHNFSRENLSGRRIIGEISYRSNFSEMHQVGKFGIFAIA